METPALLTRQRRPGRRLARPWMALGLGATTLVAGQQILGRWQGFGGQHFDRMVDLSLVTFLSIGLIWAPMWSMRTARTLWRGMERPTQRDVARQILLQGLFGAPAIWIASSWATRDVSGGWLLASSAVGSVLISLGAATTLWLRTRR